LGARCGKNNHRSRTRAIKVFARAYGDAVDETSGPVALGGQSDLGAPAIEELPFISLAFQLFFRYSKNSFQLVEPLSA